ncbi:hypothetical protein JYU34_021763 [Plutella xylostella]|uniref:Reverse transcriptase domain-containing protein n=1 Tax=Plutella xylostella TaxID=51655 RepID=A0ABQ7PRF1_PLUXY|nr:hypothetical protein JYU34_021763 [Plutella xylostella]
MCNNDNFVEEIIDENVTIREPAKMAELFNINFIDTDKKTRQDLPKKPLIALGNTNTSTIFIQPCSNDEIGNIIRSLKNTNAVGYDEFNTKVIKSCTHILAPIICHLVNMSFEQGKFPDKLKISNIKPIHKKECRKNVNNYRPVALLSIFSKIFERAMYNRIYKFIMNKDIIAKEQNGFQKGKSTSLAGFQLVKNVIESIDKGNQACVVYFDMTKAFDYVDHDLLLQKCESYGLRGLCNDWIKSYLSNRSQYVQLSNLNDDSELISHKSTLRHNKFGVPQGSIMGPLLFIIYINDLPRIINYKSILFADDISIIIPKSNKYTDIDHFQNEINNTINQIYQWLKNNNLCVNEKKTKYMIFRNRKMQPLDLKVECNSIEIERVSNTKFLGIVLDEHCSWVSHNDYVCAKLNRFIYALYKLQRESDVNTALMAYHGYITSILRYCLILWGNGTNINRTFILQKRCIRAIANAKPTDSCKPLFIKYGLLSLPSLYIYEGVCFVLKHKDLFTKKGQFLSFNTRYPNNLVLPAGKTALHGKNCHYMLTCMFNKLPARFKTMRWNMFVREVKKWLCSKCFYTVQEFINGKHDSS